MSCMRTLSRIISVVAVGLLCLMGSSCAKEETKENPILHDWCGYYVTLYKVDPDEYALLLRLRFYNDGNNCWLHYSSHRYVDGKTSLVDYEPIHYDVLWLRRDHFALYSTAGDQSLLVYSGQFVGDKLWLQAMNCDGASDSYVLFRDIYGVVDAF